MATPLKKQFMIEPQTLLKTGTCHDCGGPVQWLSSKSGAIYYNCYNSNAQGQPCQSHHRFGGYKSRDLRKGWLVANGKLQPVKMAAPTPADAANTDRPVIAAVPDQPKPEPKPAAEKKGDEYGLGL